jgi:hypothetical protein
LYFAVFEGEGLAGATEKDFFRGCLLAGGATGGAVIPTNLAGEMAP